MSNQKNKEEQNELKTLVLVSPSGHKYEVSVSDSGNLQIEYKGK